jgi:glutathionylspermidine synthase
MRQMPLPSPVDASYLALAARLQAGGVLSDPWLEGRPRFRARPVLLRAAEHAALSRAAEELTRAFHELALLCSAEPELAHNYFQLTPFQRLMWEASAPDWHALARADVFLTADGPKVCELNCDTPSGEAEAVLLQRASGALADGLHDPSRTLGERFCDVIALLGARLDRAPGPLTVGILYPTELVEDLSMILLYQRWFEERGWRVVLGSPYNLQPHGERGAALFDTRCDVFVRHYKTDWWGERLPVWDDEEPFADAQPLAQPLATLLAAEAERACAVINPFGAVLTQNKRAMAFLWEERDRFSAPTRAAVERWLPYTARLEVVAGEVASARAEWVLKSDYGCEGAEVVVGAHVSDEVWREALAHAIPSRWIAQRYFEALPDEEGAVVNHGVYVVGGVASGYLSRVQKGPTDNRALTAPTLVACE